MSNENNFDLKAEYAAEVAPLLEQLYDKCVKLGLPMVLAVKYLESGDETGLGLVGVINEKAGIRFAGASQILLGNTPEFIAQMACQFGEENSGEEIEFAAETATVQ